MRACKLLPLDCPLLRPAASAALARRPAACRAPPAPRAPPHGKRMFDGLRARSRRGRQGGRAPPQMARQWSAVLNGGPVGHHGSPQLHPLPPLPAGYSLGYYPQAFYAQRARPAPAPPARSPHARPVAPRLETVAAPAGRCPRALRAAISLQSSCGRNT